MQLRLAGIGQGDVIRRNSLLWSSGHGGRLAARSMSPVDTSGGCRRSPRCLVALCHGRCEAGLQSCSPHTSHPGRNMLLQGCAICICRARHDRVPQPPEALLSSWLGVKCWRWCRQSHLPTATRCGSSSVRPAPHTCQWKLWERIQSRVNLCTLGL